MTEQRSQNLENTTSALRLTFDPVLVSPSTEDSLDRNNLSSLKSLRAEEEEPELQHQAPLLWNHLSLSSGGRLPLYSEDSNLPLG